MQGNTVQVESGDQFARRARIALRAATFQERNSAGPDASWGDCVLLAPLSAEEANRIATQQAERETVRVSLLTQLLQSELRPVADDLRAAGRWRQPAQLSRYRRLQRTLQVACPPRQPSSASAQPAYDQLRFIDTSGQEIMRVNSGGQIVPRPQLQNRADLRFFSRAQCAAARQPVHLAPSTSPWNTAQVTHAATAGHAHRDAGVRLGRTATRHLHHQLPARRT